MPREVFWCSICYRNYELYVKDVELAADVQAGVFGTGKKSFVV